jgi:hypothetical protein
LPIIALSPAPTSSSLASALALALAALAVAAVRHRRRASALLDLGLGLGLGLGLRLGLHHLLLLQQLPLLRGQSSLLLLQEALLRLNLGLRLCLRLLRLNALAHRHSLHCALWK